MKPQDLARRLGRRCRHMAEVARAAVLFYWFPPLQAAPPTQQAVALERIHELNRLEEARRSAPGITNFGAARLRHGSELFVLIRGSEIVSSAWVTPEADTVPVREIGRRLRLLAGQRALFDLQTLPQHRGLGYASELLSRVRAELPETTIVVWLLKDNHASRRAMEKGGGQPLGRYRLWSRLGTLPARASAPSASLGSADGD